RAAGGCASLNTLTGGVRVASCNEARGRQPGIKTAPDRGLTWARALHSFAQLRQNRQNQLLFEVPLSLLHELVPSAARIALLVNPANPVPAETITKDTEAAAGTIGRHIDVFKAETSREIEMAFAALVRDSADALVVGADPLFIDRRVQI